MRCLECHGALHTIADCPFEVAPETANRVRSLVQLADRELREGRESGPTLSGIVGELQRLGSVQGVAALLGRDLVLADNFDAVVQAWKESR
jgi:hypothetical protein